MSDEKMSAEGALNVLRIEIVLAECQGPKAVRTRVKRLGQVEDSFAALIAERDALREDAERYRWLRDKANDANRSAPMVVSNPLDRSLQKLLHGERLDAAIDAALANEST